MATNTILAKMAFQISANTAEFNKSLQQSNKNFKSFANTFKGGLAALGIGLGIDQLLQFGKEVFKITAEFQKFSAVLTNTLGSSSSAQLAMKQIKEFAASTPFSVQELTASFVKLANQGFKPTTDELRSLGDLASAMGKNFDQLTEAIIDAQTGEFERLKEFGIRASKEGDKVTFTFKGVQTQTDFTADSIRKYILSLGSLEGVSGGMAAISQTLGGKVSNLGDAWDSLLQTLGEGNRGVMSDTIDLLGQAVNKANELLKTTEQRNAEEKLVLTDAVLNKYKAFGTEQEKQDFRNKLWARLFDLQVMNEQALKDWTNANYNEYQQRLKDIVVLKESLGLIGLLVSETQKEADAKNAAAAAAKKAADAKLAELEITKRLIDIDRRLNGRGQAPPGIYGNALGTTIDTKSIEAAFKRLDERIAVTAKGSSTVTKQVSQDFIEMGSLVGGSIAGIADALGQSFVDSKDFGSNMLKVVATFAAQLGQALIAIGTGLLVARKAISKPGLAIAAGVALVALAGALSASVSKAQSNFNRGSSSSSSEGVSRAGGVITSDLGERIVLSGDFRVSGTDLIASITNQNRVNSRTKFG